MVFNPPSALMQKVARFKALEHKDGKVLLWGVPCSVDPIYLQIYMYKLIINNSSNEIANSIRYHTAIEGMKIVNERFGYAETIQDKKKLLEFNTGQTEVLGLGKFEIIKMDFENKLFIVKTIKSPFAEEYKRFFGIQKKAVDYWVMGMWTGAIETLVDTEM